MQRKEVTEFISSNTGVVSDAIHALNLPDATLEFYKDRIEHMDKDASRYGSLGLAFAVAAVGVGYVTGAQPFSWEIFTAFRYPSWATSALVLTTFGGAMATAASAAVGIGAMNTKEDIAADLRERVVQRGSELAIINLSVPSSP